jgi:WD40 repeat protein
MSRVNAIASLLLRDGLNVASLASLVLDYSEFTFTQVQTKPSSSFLGFLGELADGRVVEQTARREVHIGGQHYFIWNIIINVVALDKNVALLAGDGSMVLFDAKRGTWEMFKEQVPGTLLLAAGKESLVSLHSDGKIRVWDLAARAPVRLVRPFVPLLDLNHLRNMSKLALSPNGEAVALAIDWPCIYVCSTTTGTHRLTLEGHTQTIYALAFVNDTKLASGSKDATARVWNVNTGVCLHVLQRHPGCVMSLAVLTCGFLVSQDSSGRANVWDTNTGECVITKSLFLAGIQCGLHSGGLLVKFHEELVVYE